MVTDHKEKIQPEAHLWQSETESRGHEVSLCGQRSNENIDASVRVISSHFVILRWEIYILSLLDKIQNCIFAGSVMGIVEVHVSLLLPSDSIGCGLDRLQWSKVSEMLEQVFKHANITITVYSLPQKAETTVMMENRRRWFTEMLVYCNVQLCTFLY